MNEIKKNSITSLEIAELSGKNHFDVLKAIRTMEPAWLKVNGCNFALVEYADAKGEKRPMYELSKTESLYIATKFNDEARAKLIIRWEKLENERQAVTMPISRKEIALMVIQQEEEIERLQIATNTLHSENRILESKNTFQEALLDEQAPRVRFSQSVEGAVNSCLVGELSKLLSQNGITIGQNRLFMWMRDNHYLGQRGAFYNIPTQKSMEAGWFEIKLTERTHGNGTTIIQTTTKVTGKGQIYFVNKFITAKLLSSQKITL